MFSTKTSTDVGMVPLSKQLHGKTNWQKKCRNKEGGAMTFKQPRLTFASFKACWITPFFLTFLSCASCTHAVD